MIALREQSRGVLSSFMFLPGRLPMPTRDVDVWEHATLLSRARGGVLTARKVRNSDDGKECGGS